LAGLMEQKMSGTKTGLFKVPLCRVKVRWSGSVTFWAWAVSIAVSTFNPLAFVEVGENTFLKSYYKTSIKSRIGGLYINDGLATHQSFFNMLIAF